VACTLNPWMTHAVAGWPGAVSPPKVMVTGVEWTKYVDAKSRSSKMPVLEAATNTGASLMPDQHLGQGAIGHVVCYQSADGSASVAIKTVDVEDEEDEVTGWMLLTEMRRRGLSATRMIVPTSMARVNRTTCFFMPRADGSLQDFAEEVDPCSAALAVTKALRVLYTEGFMYCDIKPANVLVKKEGEVFHIVLGDLGSLVRLRRSGVSTYPPPEHPSGLNVPATERAAAWGVCMLLLTLLNGHDQTFSYIQDAVLFTPWEEEAHKHRVMAVVASRIDELGRKSSIGEVLEYGLENATASLFGIQVLLEKSIRNASDA
jgi:serine/threonine protein kinase